MKEEYVSYERAVKLKELGFKDKCNAYYWTEDKAFECTNSIVHKNSDTCQTVVMAPSLWQAQKWLREVKDMDVLVFNNACGYGWEISKSNSDSRGTTIALFDDKGNDKDSGMWLSYELALSAGIDKALELLTDKLNEIKQ